MRLVSFKPMLKGSLRGFATVELPIGLTICDCPVLVSNGKLWATLPRKPITDRDGQHLRAPDGKSRYQPVLEWKSRDLSDGFSNAVGRLVRQAHPGVLDGGAP